MRTRTGSFPEDEDSRDLERQEIIDDAPLDLVITEDFIRRLEIAADLYQRRYLPLALKLTNAGDWVRHGERYSLQASGAEKLCNPFGITWDRPIVHKHEREDATGAYYEYEVEGIVKSAALKRWGWFTGNCDSRDPFFVARTRKKDDKGQTIEGPVTEGDIRKSAFSNWLVNGTARLIGIRNPTAAMLEAAGLNVGTISAPDYSGKSSRTVEHAGDKISEAQQKRFYAISRQAGWTDAQVKGLLASFKLTSSAEIPRNQYEELCLIVGKAPGEWSQA